ncbi:hypothetical protein FQA39_LY04395 [Lamprigera yunnana]|nr:hypothetical protein FQA39_LY04395 [Lamprigera yunnana]
MVVEYNKSCRIKSEVIVEETFSYFGKYEDDRSRELKVGLAGFGESFKCKEGYNLEEHICGVSIHQHICNECNFITIEKDSLMEHFKIHNRAGNVLDTIVQATGVSKSTVIRILKQGRAIECGEKITFANATPTPKLSPKSSVDNCGEQIPFYPRDIFTWYLVIILHFLGEIVSVVYLANVMDVDYNKIYPIKSEVIVNETFSYCGKYEDDTSADLKVELVDFEKSFKCKEEYNLDTDACGVPIHQYICNECNFISTEKDSLIEHLKITKNVQYFCKKCNFNTLLRCSIKEHFRIHNRVGSRHMTKKCKFKTPRIFSLTPQLKTIYKYICNECDYKTLWRWKLKEHGKIHTGDEYKCKLCDFKTPWKQNLKQHVKIHNDDKYKCKECHYKTVRKDQLKAHIRIHTGEEYKCNECDYKTPWKQRLKAHAKIHTGNKYNCNECDFKTLSELNLREHMKIHSGEEYKCSECDYKTVRKCHLKRHMKIHAGDAYKCMECDYKTPWIHCLKIHMTHHNVTMIENSKANEETTDVTAEHNNLNYQVLIDLCNNNINFFVNDTSDNGQRLYNASKTLKENIDKIRSINTYLSNVAAKYKFDESTPANGYYSYFFIVNNAMLQAIELSRRICLKRGNILFRKSSYAKEIEASANLMSSLHTYGNNLNDLSSWHKEDELFFIDLPDELLTRAKDLDQHPFYGRNLGFQYCESLRPILRFVTLSMVIFSEAFYSQGSIFSKAKNSVTTTARYLIDPEERAKRILHVFQFASLDFLKSFWFLTESELMKQVPFVVGQSVAVSKLIQIPPQSLVINVNEEEIDVPIPSSHIGKRPIQVRLISHDVREGMIGEANTKSKVLPQSRALLIHCHGGGFCAQSSQSHEVYLRQWAKDLETPILSIDYSLAPQAPYPRALEEVVYAYSWALQNHHWLGTTAERVLFVGDSAGGNLLLGLIQKCILMNLPLPAGFLGVYTPTWLSFNISPSRLLSFMDPLIPLGFALRLIRAYAFPPKFHDSQNAVLNGECLSDTDSCEEISQSDLVELQAHKSPVSDASESITCGSLSSPIVEIKDVKQIEISQTNLDYTNQSTSHNENSFDLIETNALESDAETDETKVNLSKEPNTPSDFEVPFQNRLLSMVTNLRNRIGMWVSSRHKGTELPLDANKPLDIVEQLKLAIPTDYISSPCFAPSDILLKFPTVKLLTTNLDPFLDDNVIFSSKLKKLGKNVTLDVLHGLPHGFLNFSLLSKESEAGSKLCVQRMKEILDLDSLPPLPPRIAKLQNCFAVISLAFCLVFMIVALLFVVFGQGNKVVHVLLISKESYPLYVTNEKFLSVALDSSQIAKGFKNFNLTDTKLVKLLKPLSPGYLRIGGTMADRLWFVPDNKITYQNENLIQSYDEECEYCSLYDRPNFTMTAKEWVQLNQLAQKSNFTILFDLNCLIRYPNGTWNSTNAEELISFSNELGYNIIWQLGNEPNAFKHIFNYEVKATQLAGDFQQLRNILNKYPMYRKSLLVGPDTTRPIANRIESMIYLQDFLTVGQQTVDAVTWHQYYFNGRTATIHDFLDLTIFNMLEVQIYMIKDILTTARAQMKPIWLGETSSAYGGGVPNCSNSFVSTFIWLDKLGVAARNGLDVVVRQSFFGGNYSLVSKNLDPLPDWWISVLYKMLVGRKVIPCYLPSSEMVRLYCHCNLNPSSIVVYGFNLNNEVARVELGGYRQKVLEFSLTADGSLQSKHILLNGRRLELTKNGDLPVIWSRLIYADPYLMIPPQSLVFWIVPIDMPTCKFNIMMGGGFFSFAELIKGEAYTVTSFEVVPIKYDNQTVASLKKYSEIMKVFLPDRLKLMHDFIDSYNEDKDNIVTLIYFGI